MLVARQQVQEKLQSFYQSNEAEFAAVWGRRRVGKTYLIKQTFKNKNGYYLQVMGEKGGSLPSQLGNFTKALTESFYPKGVALKSPKSWKAAFDVLTSTIKSVCGEKKVVLFFDELPWLAGGKSQILSAIDYYWNNFWVDMPNIKLIVCGSAASWMMDKVVSNKGGLHNRINLKIRLEPFTLKQTQEFLLASGHQYTPEQVLQIYLVVGGIPFYLKLFQKKYSIAQNIDDQCFTSTGILFNEFDELYSSLFNNSEIYEEIVEVLASHPQGLKRVNLIKRLKLSTDGGGLNRRLKSLVESGFVDKQMSYVEGKKEERYKLVDEYTTFYFRWIKPEESVVKTLGSLGRRWRQVSESQQFIAWRGLAFERCCYKQLKQILGILNIQSVVAMGPWQAKGVQVDLYIDRSDDAIMLCEMKYTNSVFSLNKKYAAELRNKLVVFREKSKTRKQVILCFISVSGLNENQYTKELVAWDITLSDLLAEA